MSGDDYKTIRTADILGCFLRVFGRKGCVRYHSSPLSPDDP